MGEGVQLTARKSPCRRNGATASQERVAIGEVERIVGEKVDLKGLLRKL